MKLLRTLSAARHELPRVLPLLRSAGVPLWAKAALIAAALLVVSPLNILGDIPFFGFFDDAALLLLVLHTFVRFAEDRTARRSAPYERVVQPTVVNVSPKMRPS